MSRRKSGREPQVDDRPFIVLTETKFRNLSIKDGKRYHDMKNSQFLFIYSFFGSIFNCCRVTSHPPDPFANTGVEGGGGGTASGRQQGAGEQGGGGQGGSETGGGQEAASPYEVEKFSRSQCPNVLIRQTQ